MRLAPLSPAALYLILAGCASDPDYGSVALWNGEARIETPDQPLQCVPYARERSGINIRGDAGTWWELAAGRYERSSTPKLGSVLVLMGYGGAHRGHVAVVTAVESDRQIRVDHANWFGDGRIYRDDPVVDVSSDNDWSSVRVWDIRDNVLGSRTYPVQGFIGPEPENSLVASGD